MERYDIGFTDLLKKLSEVCYMFFDAVDKELVYTRQGINRHGFVGSNGVLDEFYSPNPQPELGLDCAGVLLSIRTKDNGMFWFSDGEKGLSIEIIYNGSTEHPTWQFISDSLRRLITEPYRNVKLTIRLRNGKAQVAPDNQSN